MTTAEKLRQEGMLEGIQKGIQEGMLKGRQEGVVLIPYIGEEICNENFM